MLDRCPGVLHAVPARDGLLARVRVPGGLISCAQWTALARLARRCGDGRIDITARANVQLRGLRVEALPELTAELEAAGLLPSRSHERVRNILASPFAGLDAGEMLDVRPLVRALDAGLCADPALASLPAKFCFALDGGGSYKLDTTYADIVFRAAEEGAEASTERIVERLLQEARAAGGKRLFPRDSSANDAARSFRAPLGASEAQRPELVNLAPSVPLGRLSAEQADGIGELVSRYGGELRLAPWRGILLGAMPRAASAELALALRELGLPLGGPEAEGYAGIVACAGIEGCTEALADVRRDAEALARRLAAERSESRRRAISLAACPKRCGMPRGVGLELVATGEGYDVYEDGVILQSGRGSL